MLTVRQLGNLPTDPIHSSHHRFLNDHEDGPGKCVMQIWPLSRAGRVAKKNLIQMAPTIIRIRLWYIPNFFCQRSLKRWVAKTPIALLFAIWPMPNSVGMKPLAGTFFPGLRPSSRTLSAYDTTCSKKVLPAVLHFVAAPCLFRWGSCRRCPAWPVTRQQGDRRLRNKQMETVRWHKQLDM